MRDFVEISSEMLMIDRVEKGIVASMADCVTPIRWS